MLNEWLQFFAQFFTIEWMLWIGKCMTSLFSWYVTYSLVNLKKAYDGTPHFCLYTWTWTKFMNWLTRGEYSIQHAE